jgi:CubicO group peptidase (beta-lactamase class C family)
MTKALAFAALLAAFLVIPGVSAPPPTPAMPPQETLVRLGINSKALETLLKRGTESHSDAIVVIKDDQVIGQWYYGKPQAPIEAMSATKSVASLAIGCLLHDGKIKSLDEPVCDFYPEWNQGRKKLITIRQLLNHTSGLQADRTTEEIYASPDFVQLALCAELSDAPGSKFFYNNKAVNLLAGIVQKASGQRMDQYLAMRVFAPLGINDYHWDTDPAGNTQVMAGLQIHAMDMAKIGQMLADGGIWKGKQIIDASWIAEMTAPGQTLTPECGLLWWLEYQWSDKGTVNAGILQSWRQGGVPAIYITRVTPLVGKVFPIPELLAKLNVVFDGHDNKLKYLYNQHIPQMRYVTSPLVAYNANGFLGQYLVIVPKEHLVAVRQISQDSFKNKDTDEFDDFHEIVPTLVGETVEPQ